MNMQRINLHNEKIFLLCKKYFVKTLSAFGSTARGEATSASDIDILVTFSKPISLLQLVALERELSKILGGKVDLLTEQSISPYLRAHILKECRPIYAA